MKRYMPITRHQNLRGRWKNIRWFAAVVRSTAAVRNAFEGHRVLAWWWEKVLALHGRPVPTNLSVQDRSQCIADGFRFYGWLYRVLAVVFGMAAILCWVGNISDSFWITTLITSAIYLWTTAGLAFSGAMQFHNSAGERIWQLVAFLFFITLFLASAVTAFSMQMRFAGWLPDALNFAFTVGIMALGVGSYLVELAVLVTRAPAQKARST